MQIAILSTSGGPLLWIARGERWMTVPLTTDDLAELIIQAQAALRPAPPPALNVIIARHGVSPAAP